MRSAVQGTIGEMVAGNESGDSPGNDRSSLVRAPTRAEYSFADTDRAVILPIGSLFEWVLSQGSKCRALGSFIGACGRGRMLPFAMGTDHGVDSPGVLRAFLAGDRGHQHEHVGRFVVPPCTRHCSSRLAPPGLMTSANTQHVSAPLPRIGLRPTAFRFCARIATVEVDRRRQRHREMVVHRRGHDPVPAASRLPNCAARPGFRTDRGRQRDLEEGPPQGDCGRATLSRRARASTSRPSGASPNGASSGASPSTRSSPWWSRPMSSSSPARSRRRASSSISPRSGCSPRPWHGYRTVWPAHKHDASTVVVLI